MYPVSQEYLNKIMSGSVSVEWSGTITLTNGAQFPFTMADLVQGQTKITRAISSGSDVEIGSTCSAELSMGIYLPVNRYVTHGAVIDIKFTLILDDDSREDVECGQFVVTEPATRYRGVVTIHAYDAMVKFNGSFADSLVAYPFDILQYACSACGVQLGSTRDEIVAMPNGNVQLFTYTDESGGSSEFSATYRDLVGYVAAALGGFATIGVDGKLYIKQYGTTSIRTIPANWRYDYRPQDYETHYSGISLTNMGDGAATTVTDGSDGLIYDLGRNPLMQYSESETQESMLQAILNKLHLFSYTPFTAQVPVDPSLTVGDVISFADGIAVAGKLSAITSMTITIGGGMELSCAGTNPDAIDTPIDKALAEALSRNVDNEVKYYTFTNASDIEIGDGANVPIINLRFASVKPTRVIFHAEIALTAETKADNDTDFYDAIATVTYIYNEAEIREYHPVETWMDGDHILHLLYYVITQSAQMNHFVVMLQMTNGSAFIPMAHIRSAIYGQGLAASDTWDGVLDLGDDFAGVSTTYEGYDSTNSMDDELLHRSDYAVTRKTFTDHIEESVTYSGYAVSTLGMDDEVEVEGEVV